MFLEFAFNAILLLVTPQKETLMFLVIGLQALYGFSIPISKILLQHASPFFASSIRMLLAGIGLLGFEKFYNKKDVRPVLSNPQLQIYSLTLYMKYMMRAWYIKEMSCVRMAFFFNLGPFIAAFLSYLFLSEQLSPRKWLGMSIGCIAGMWPVLYSCTNQQMPNELHIGLPDAVLLFAMVINFYGLIIKRKLLTQDNLSISAVNGTGAVASGALGLATSYHTEGFFPVSNVGYFAGWVAILFMLSNVICRNLYALLLKRFSVTFLSLADFLMNICIALYGWLLFNETITVDYVVSSAIVCLGLYVFYLDELQTVSTKHGHPVTN